MRAPSIRQVPVGIVFVAVLVGQVLHAAQQTPATTVLSNDRLKVTVNDPRPLARVVDELEQLCGCAITYEDNRLSARRDLVEVPSDSDGGERLLIPRGGRFEFSYGGITTLVHQRVPGVLASLVHEYNGSSYPGRFTMTITGAVFHVVPAQATERETAMGAPVSLLDAPIHLEGTERTMSEAIEAVNHALTEATGETVTLSYPAALFEGRRLVVGAEWEPARDGLVRILASSRQRLSWRLLYDAAKKTYALNVHVIRPR
jgi:hypothetical protein